MLKSKLIVVDPGGGGWEGSMNTKFIKKMSYGAYFVDGMMV
jgi:hypothetical protein